MKKIIVSTLICGILIGIFCLPYLANRTIRNKEDAIGNSAGNLLNGGLFCENDGLIYFSNKEDNGNLYVMNSDMTNVKKLYDDTCSYINTTNRYIIYVRDNHKRDNAPGQFFNFNTVGIYRLDKKNEKNIKQLYSKPAGITSLKGNTVYYQHYDTKENLQFYQVDIDGSNEEKIMDEPISPASILGNSLYYNGVDNDHSIHSMNLDTTAASLVYSGNCYHVIATNDSLYFLSLSNNYAIARTTLDGENPELLENERCSFFNLSKDETYLYYQIDGGDKNRLCQMNLSTLESKTLKEGNFNSIHTTKNYVFFQEFETNQMYYLTIKTGEIKRFQPAVEE